MRETRIHLAIASVAAAFLLAIALAAFNLIEQQRNSALANSQQQASRFVMGAVAAINRTLLDIDVLLASLDETEDLSNLHLDEMNWVAANKTLITIDQRNLRLHRLTLLDTQSHVLASSDPAGVAPLILSAGFVERTLGLPIATLTLSEPALDASSAQQVIYMARHLKLTDGSKILAVAEMTLADINSIMVQGADISGLEVSLERGSGQLLASIPAQDNLLGKPLATPLGQGTQGAQRLNARLSGLPAVVAAQPILYDNALIAASIPIHAALEKWQQDRNFILLTAGLFAAMVLIASGFTSWYLSRLAQARSAIKQSKAEIEHLAFFDHLTDLPNRLLLMDRLGHALVTNVRHQRYGALLFLDLDNFKNLNDTQGHDVGDLLLKQIATRLQASVRMQDTVARLGGDEFVILLEDISANPIEAAEAARRVGQKLLMALDQPYTFNGKTHKSSVSMGAALYGVEPMMPAELLKQADIAMYQAKARGRNTLCFFDPQMQASITAHAELESDLHTAIAEQQFILYYQPQVTQTGAVLGAEVLIRWQHSTRGMVPPFEFIPVAEESELINQIGQWVLQTACQQLRIWQQIPATAHLQLAVNVSARQFRQTDFVSQVQQVIDTTGVAPHGLKLELTESLVLTNVDDTIAKMSALKGLGVRFSMDDFGTGQSSLSYLTRLPLDQLKIDQSFVRNIGIKSTDGVIVQTIIGMARNLGLEVIAEGVETTAQQTYLAEHGCTLYQGYLLGKPTPLAEFESLLARSINSA